MAKFWFISAPLVSHLDWGGFLKTAQLLQHRGHDVTWISGSDVGGALAGAGIPFAPVRQTGWLWPPPPAPDLSSIPPQEAVMLRYRRALDTWLSEDLVSDAVEAICELAQSLGTPDVIVTDPFLSAAALAAEKLGVTLAVAGWPAQNTMNEEHLFPVQKELGSDSQQRIARLCERFGLDGQYFADGPTPSILSPYLHITYFSESWYAADSGSILPQTLFVGGQVTPPRSDPPQWLTDIPATIPLALITLGSTFTGDLGFFGWAAHAAAQMRYLPIVVIGYNPIEPEDKEQLIRALPRSTRLLNWVPFDHVLPRVELMVHHGGMGTTHAAILHGIPQIVVPHAADQRGQARRVAQAKVGLNLSAHDVRNGMLLEAARALTREFHVRQNAQALAAEFHRLGGPPTAATALEELAAAQSPSN